jgi:hypothetical protein
VQMDMVVQSREADYHAAMTRKAAVSPVVTWIDIEDVMSSDRSQIQKDTWHVTPWT